MRALHRRSVGCRILYKNQRIRASLATAIYEKKTSQTVYYLGRRGWSGLNPALERAVPFRVLLDLLPVVDDRPSSGPLAVDIGNITPWSVYTSSRREDTCRQRTHPHGRDSRLRYRHTPQSLTRQIRRASFAGIIAHSLIPPPSPQRPLPPSRNTPSSPCSRSLSRLAPSTLAVRWTHEAGWAITGRLDDDVLIGCSAHTLYHTASPLYNMMCGRWRHRHIEPPLQVSASMRRL